jgi:flagellar protein FliJ
MAAFRFRLATLLRLRENVRDDCRAQLAAAQRAQDIIYARIAELSGEIDQLRQRVGIVSRPGTVDVDQLLEASRYEMTLKAQRQSADEQRRAVEAEVERRRQALVEADREVKTLEKLREQQTTRHQLEQHRRETKQLDATAIQLHYGKEKD